MSFVRACTRLSRLSLASIFLYTVSSVHSDTAKTVKSVKAGPVCRKLLGNDPAVDKLAADFIPTPEVKLTRNDIVRMTEKEKRIIVTFQGKVYDVTAFSGHPGGYGRLEMVSGQDLEPFWKVYTQHNRGHIVEILKLYCIGHLSDEEAEEQRKNSFFENPYKHDPEPYPELLTNTRYPYNAESDLRLLTESWITPVGRHFVRNHGTVPPIDPAQHELVISGVGLKDTTFTVEDLKKLPKVDVTTVIQCNGNRREDYHYLKENIPAFGPPHWVSGAISNATWSGVRLRDLLQLSGLDMDGIALRKTPTPEGATAVAFMGADHDEVGNNYCCSIPFEKVADPFGDVIVAYEMNGEPIPASHGFPLRAIVPGHAGARNCKYLRAVEVTPAPCHGCGNWKQYAVHAPDVPLKKLAEFEVHSKELKRDPVVQEMPVQSLITIPSAGDVLALSGDLDSPTIRVKGLAWGGGGSAVNRVDVSLDGGKSFTRAELLPQPIEQRRGNNWAWQFFEQDLPIPSDYLEKLKEGKSIDLELTSKALNTSWNVQPESADPNYNPHGCCVNHWYRVPVKVDPTISSDILGQTRGEFRNKPSGGSFRKPFRHFDPPPCKF